MVGKRSTVFIHTNEKQFVGAVVGKYAILKHARRPASFDVDIIKFEDYDALTRRHGQPYLRGGRVAIWDNNDPQSFRPLRFLPPQLMDYQGRAVVIDPDVFAVADIGELLERDMGGKAIFCREVRIRRKHLRFYSSVMLLDCSRLTHWRWEEQLDALFSQRIDYPDWMCLKLEPRENIGLLEEEWNHFDTLTERTKALHTTRPVTQPWKTGLPIDFSWERPKGWKAVRLRLAAWRRGQRYYYNSRYYVKHPDPRQESLFFQLLKEGVEKRFVSRAVVEEAIHKKYVRSDALELIGA